jgi:hypothetical protein
MKHVEYEGHIAMGMARTAETLVATPCRIIADEFCLIKTLLKIEFVVSLTIKNAASRSKQGVLKFTNSVSPRSISLIIVLLLR